VLRAGVEPATCRSASITGTAPARSRVSRRGLGMRTGSALDVRAGYEPARRGHRLHQITGPLRPATGMRPKPHPSKPARIRTRTCEVGARRASSYTTGLRSGRPGSNGPPRSGAPVLCRLSYVREWMRYARLDSNQRPPPSQDGALSAELRACVLRCDAGDKRRCRARALGRSRTRTSAVQRARACR
jgi:hypothetical protein